jgi:hypothetical protein
MHYLSLNERLRPLALSGVTISFRLLAEFVTEPTYPQNRIVVSSCYVGISMTDIFASLANIHLKLKHFPHKKKLFFPHPPRKLTKLQL